MAADFDTLADATVRIVSGNSSGSGFHFLRPEIVVTADHVVEDDRNTVEAIAEDGSGWNLRYLAHSPRSDYDFAIFEINGKTPPPNRKALLPPDQPELPSRGADIALAGFPHGIADLLVQRGIIAGPNADEGFYVDAPVNAGNSGGPVIDASSGRVIGVVTDSRFLEGDELEKMSNEAQRLEVLRERRRTRISRDLRHGFRELRADGRRVEPSTSACSGDERQHRTRHRSRDRIRP